VTGLLCLHCDWILRRWRSVSIFRGCARLVVAVAYLLTLFCLAVSFLVGLN
jgi:hypothetical protein